MAKTKANQTIETKASVSDFLKQVKDESKRKDCTALIKLLEQHTSLKAKMWGPAIIGFGTYHYVYESGREGDAPLVGLSPRANAITLYLSDVKSNAALLNKLGKHKLGGGCLYIQKLDDIDSKILLKLVDHSISHINSKYPS